MLYVGITTLCLLSIFYVIFRSAILNNYETMERNDSREGMKRILYSYFDEYRSLGSVTLDYASWDDTFDFVSTPSDPRKAESYVSGNFTDSMFANVRLDIAVLLDDGRRVRYAKAYESELRHALPYPQTFIDTLFRRYPNLIAGPQSSGTVGLLLLDGKPIIAASYPILTSNNEGPARGTLIFARYLDEEFVRYLSEKADTQISFLPAGQASSAVPAETETIRGPGMRDFSFWTVADASTIQSNVLLKDVLNEPAVVLQFSAPRELYRQAERSIQLYMVFFLLAGAAFFVIVNVIWQRLVFSRVNRLKWEMKSIRTERDFSMRIHVGRNDEFAQLEKSFNRMMASLETAQDEIKYQAEYDPLTRIANRNGFFKFMDRMIEESLPARRPFTVLFVDLDHFNTVNVSMGHHTGDLLLRKAAGRLRGVLREGDFLCRLGGDEFCVVSPEDGRVDEREGLAGRIKEALVEPIDLGGGRFHSVTVSIGISLFPEHGEDAESLLQHADAAMLDAKESGRDGYRRYTEQLEKSRLRKSRIEQLLKRAAANGELRLHYQPKWDVSADKVAGVEALLRWDSPELGAVSPLEFIPAAESTGLIHEIGEWVIRAACRQYLAWRSDKPDLSLVVAVNVSGIQLLTPGFAEKMCRILQEEGMDPRAMELEVTESFAIEKFGEVTEVLTRLREEGFLLSIDDFGAGYSSMKYLCQLPVQCMKIDKALIDSLGEDLRHQIVVSKIIEMAHRLQLIVVAEGVETLEQLEFLRFHQCDQIQGYFISKPVPADRVFSFAAS
uniref:EAL domain-containing protein n=2 Tax=Cohnella candidum TaxID=2674991 RepID=A0A3G3K169_9BACL|nr:EAL domain-containing protein [Cohnella candidum]